MPQSTDLARFVRLARLPCSELPLRVALFLSLDLQVFHVSRLRAKPASVEVAKHACFEKKAICRSARFLALVLVIDSSVFTIQ